MAVTPAGTPYVESSDNVADYPGVSLALANHIDGLDGGKVLQVVSVTKVDTFTTTSTSYVDITGLSVAITPSATTSKILVFYKIALNTPDSGVARLQLVRGAVVIGGGTAVGNRASAMSSFFDQSSYSTTDLNGNFLDSPATVSALTYKIQGAIHSPPLTINRTANDADVLQEARTSSTITVLEISA